jgi:translation elongation factor EF-Tu-like GTPase
MMRSICRGLILVSLLTVVGSSQAVSAATTLPAESSIPARLTLLPLHGAVGRETPFYRGYRPFFVFAGSKAQVACAIEPTGGEERVVPGQTAEVLLRCAEAATIDATAPTFIFLEGGRKVGEGELKLAH